MEIFNSINSLLHEATAAVAKQIGVGIVGGGFWLVIKYAPIVHAKFKAVNTTMKMARARKILRAIILTADLGFMIIGSSFLFTAFTSESPATKSFAATAAMAAALVVCSLLEVMRDLSSRRVESLSDFIRVSHGG